MRTKHGLPHLSERLRRLGGTRDRPTSGFSVASALECAVVPDLVEGHLIPHRRRRERARTYAYAFVGCFGAGAR